MRKNDESWRKSNTTRTLDCRLAMAIPPPSASILSASRTSQLSPLELVYGMSRKSSTKRFLPRTHWTSIACCSWSACAEVTWPEIRTSTPSGSSSSSRTSIFRLAIANPGVGGWRDSVPSGKGQLRCRVGGTARAGQQETVNGGTRGGGIRAILEDPGEPGIPVSGILDGTFIDQSAIRVRHDNRHSLRASDPARPAAAIRRQRAGLRGLPPVRRFRQLVELECQIGAHRRVRIGVAQGPVPRRAACPQPEDPAADGPRTTVGREGRPANPHWIKLRADPPRPGCSNSGWFRWQSGCGWRLWAIAGRRSAGSLR